MKSRLAKRICSTCVPPNYVRASGYAFDRSRHQEPQVSPVSGATPATTRRRRVLQASSGDFCYV